MNRDNILFVVLGLLAGFIAGYLGHEVMSERQPARRIVGGPGTAAPPAGPMASPPPPDASSQQAAMDRVTELRRYVAENPDDADALRLLANMNYDISNWQGAAELYERFLALRPGDVDVLTDLGACYRNLGQHEDALARFQRVREIAPNHWQSRYNEVLVLAFDLGRLDEARRAMAELAELQPGNADVERLAAEIERRAQGA